MSRRTEARPRRRDQRTESDISMTPEKERVKKLWRSVVKKMASTVRI